MAVDTKAPDAAPLHIATAGNASFNMGPFSFDLRGPTGDQLVKRYGMWVHRCVSLNAQAAASVPFKLMRRERNQDLRKDCIRAGIWKQVPDRTRRFLNGKSNLPLSSTVRKAIQGNPDDLVEVDQHPLLDVLHMSNDWTSGCQHRTGLYSDLQIFGVAYDLLIDEDTPTAMWSIRPHLTSVIKDRTNFVGGFKVGMDPDAVIYEPEEVLWYRLYDPEDPWSGRGPLEAWLSTVDASFAIQDFQMDLMSRMGSPDWLMSKAPMSPDQKRAFWREWARLFGRMFRRQRNVAIIDGEAELTRLSDTPKELEYQASEAAKRDQIANAFGVPTALVDVSVIRANSREAKNAHIETTVWPMVQLIEDVWNQKLVPRYGDDLFIVHENPIPDDETIRIQERASKLAAGWTPNEIRIEEGVEPLAEPAADEAYLPNTLVPMRAGTLRLDMDMAVAENGMAQPEAPDDTEALPDVEVQPEQVLTGQQIAAVLAIVQAVIDDKIPIESARGQLIVLYNLSDEQANAILAGVEGFEKPEPEVPPMLPGQPQEGQQPPQRDEEQQRAYVFELISAKRDMNAMAAKMASIELEYRALQTRLQFPNGKSEVPNVHVYTQIPDSIHEHMVNVSMGEPNIQVHVPRQDAPIVNVDAKAELPAPITNVTVEAQPQAPPQPAPITTITVEGQPPPPAQVTNVVVEKQDMPAPIVNVHQEKQDVPVPDIYVEAPQVEARIEPQQITLDIPEQPTPIVNVENKQEAPIVQPQIVVEPEININAEIELPPRKIEIQRDRDTGTITGAEVRDDDG